MTDPTSDRPLVTFALFAYNQEKYIRAAVEGALAQDYENLEIILSDDCSTDSTFSIIKSMADSYQGPHKITVNRNFENKGLAAHFNKIMAMASGETVVVAAGDDISLTDRVSRTVRVFKEHPNVMLVSFLDHLIDKDGLEIRLNSCSDYSKYDLVSIDEYLSGTKVPISGASRGFRYEVYKTFGALAEDCPTEDTPYKLRGLMMGCAYIFRAPGIYYRKHDTNLSGTGSINYLNFRAIAAQYKRDVALAKEQKIISDGLQEKCSRWVEKNMRRRYLQKDLHERKVSLRDFISKVLLASDHTLREKLGMAKQLLLVRW